MLYINIKVITKNVTKLLIYSEQQSLYAVAYEGVLFYL